MKKTSALIIFFLILFFSFIRLYKLDTLPPSMYWEEAALGYDAYSIFKTGKDHHGNVMPLIAFESFGDWKPSLYFYSIVPFIALFGLNEWAVRLPAAISGILTMIACAGINRVLYKKFFGNKKLSDAVSSEVVFIISLIVAGFSPWLLMFSRGGWEVMLATALISWGVLLTLMSIHKKNALYFVLSALLLVLSMYTYHAARLIAPFLGLGLLLLKMSEEKKDTPVFEYLKENVKAYAVTLSICCILLLPLFLSLTSSSVQQRFTETSIFTDLSIIQESNALKELAGNTVISRLMYHRYVLFSREVLINFFSHFSLAYLFIEGDSNVRHSTQFFGTMYIFEAIALLLGVVTIIKTKSRYTLFVLFWLCISMLPAAMTKATPHALRTLPALPVFIMIISFGWLQLLLNIQKLSKKISFLTMRNATLLLFGVYVIQFGVLWKFYSSVYAKIYAKEWQYGYKQMYTELKSITAIYPDTDIFITREIQRPAMYYWFFNQTDPVQVQSENDSALKDQGEYLSYKNISFVTDTASLGSKKGILVVSKAGHDALEKQKLSNLLLLKTVQNPMDEVVWYMYLLK